MLVMATSSWLFVEPLQVSGHQLDQDMGRFPHMIYMIYPQGSPYSQMGTMVQWGLPKAAAVTSKLAVAGHRVSCVHNYTLSFN